MPIAYRQRIEVRFRDCDPLGHVNNAVYLTYLEMTRFGFWTKSLGLDPMKDKPSFIMARSECDYKSQATIGDELEVRLSIGALGRSSFVYEYDVVRVEDERLVAVARTVQVMFDYEAQKPVPIPTDLREILEKRSQADPSGSSVKQS